MIIREPERTVLNHMQEKFPVETRPFRTLERSLKLPEKEIIETVKRLLNKGFLSRFGAVINPRAFGGSSRLAALSAPEHELERVIETVNSHPVVSHNYIRDHEINLWFVLSADDISKIDETIDWIETQTGHRVFSLPKLKEYYVGLKFLFHPDGAVTTENVHYEFKKKQTTENSEATLDKFEEELIRSIEAGLPLSATPYQDLANRLGVSQNDVLAGFESMLESGKIKRLGCVPNHYGLGIKGNGMIVMNIPDEKLNDVGETLGDRPEVTHCYERPRYQPDWPYNLFAMVHSRTREGARHLVNSLLSELNLENYPYDVLFSTRLLKKTGLRLA